MKISCLTAKKKNILLCILLILIITTVGWFAYAYHELQKPLLQVENLIEIISPDAATAKTFSWQSDDTAASFYMEYHKKGTTNSQQVQESISTAPAYRAQERPQQIHSVYLTGLEANTTYEYRLCTAKKATEWKSFTTVADTANHYKVLIFGDSQAADYSVWGKTAATAWDKNKDSAFFINMGDIVDNGQDYWQWRQWFQNARPLLDNLPFAPILGNHEAYSLDWKEAKPEAFTALFAVPANGPADQKHLAYSFDYGNVHYVALNSDYQEISEWYPSMMESERDWLDQDLAKARQDHKRIIVLSHRPMWSWRSPDHDINGEYFVPLFDKYGVELVLTAHFHYYSRTYALQADKPAEKGTVYILTGRSGEKFWSGPRRRDVDAAAYNPSDMTMYVTLEVEPSDFKVTAYKIDGTIIDSAIIPTT